MRVSQINIEAEIIHYLDSKGFSIKCIYCVKHGTAVKCSCDVRVKPVFNEIYDPFVHDEYKTVHLSKKLEFSVVEYPEKIDVMIGICTCGRVYYHILEASPS